MGKGSRVAFIGSMTEDEFATYLFDQHGVLPRSAWRDKPPVDGLYLKVKRGRNTLFAKAIVVVQHNNLADAEGYRYFGPIPPDPEAKP